MKFDDVLAEVNGFGRFQLLTIAMLVIPRMTLPFHFLLNNFIAATPSHHCNISSLDDGHIFMNLSEAERIRISIPLRQDGSPDSCQMFAEPQYHLLLNSSNFTDLPTVPCQNGWIYDNSTFKSTLATEWDLVCDNKRMTKATAVVFFAGVMTGAALFGYLSDRFGRKRMLLFSYTITTLFGFASAFSYNFAMFAAMRYFTGIGAAGISIITVVLCIEWVDINHRAAAGVLMSLDWSFCTSLLPAVAYFVTDWRGLTMAVTSPLFAAMICWWWLPESARWLMSNVKVNEAHFYLKKCAMINRRKEVMADLKPEVLSKVVIAENANRKYSFLDLLRTPRIRRRALLLCIVWCGLACTYYGISLNIAGFGVNIYLTQFIYGVCEIPAKLFICFTLDLIGRRWNQGGMLILTGLCLFCNIFIPTDQRAFRTSVAALGKMFGEGAFTTLYLFTTELYPTVLRQNGLGFGSFVARLGICVSPLVLLLEEVWVHLPGLIFGIVAFTAALSSFLLPETQNVRLAETIEDVEQRRRRSVSTSDEKSPP